MKTLDERIEAAAMALRDNMGVVFGSPEEYWAHMARAAIAAFQAGAPVVEISELEGAWGDDYFALNGAVICKESAGVMPGPGTYAIVPLLEADR
jgi:hypothetical protein